MTIPKIIHQTWKSRKLTGNFKRWAAQWKAMHPDYEYRFYDDKDLRREVEKHFPEHLSAYDAFAFQIERVDFARYVILYAYGGIYTDMDTYPLKPFHPFLREDRVLLGEEPAEHPVNRVCNATMISPKKCEFWVGLMEFIVENYHKSSIPVETTGPGAIGEFMKVYEGDDVLILDSCVFYPKWHKGDGSAVSDQCDISKSYSVHEWNGTWYSFSFFANEGRVIIVTILAIIIVLVLIYAIMKRRSKT